MDVTKAPHGQNVRVVRPPSKRTHQSGSGVLKWTIRLSLLGATSVVLLFLIAALYLALHQLHYDKRIYPGVSAYGVDLSGLTREQAMAALSAQYTYGDSAVFTFRDGDRVWQYTAAELGVRFDPTRTIEAAYQVGRGGGLINNLIGQGNAWVNGTAIQPVVVFDQSQAQAVLEQIAGEINRPVLDATLQLRGSTVTATTSQTGRQLDAGATLGLVRQVVLNMNTGAEIPLVVRETAPTVPDVSAAAERLQLAVSGPVTLFIEAATTADPGPWEASPDFIGGLLSATRVANDDGTFRYEIGTNPAPLRAFLQGLADQLRIEPEDARFVFNDSTRVLEVIRESVNGRVLDIDATVTRFAAAIFEPANRRVPLVFNTVVPQVNSAATGAELGITEQIARATTFFYGSSAERRTNIQIAASRFHGLVIAPGQEFSFNRYLGDVSPESGYETGLVIYGNRTIQGVGGGVCQVSTTVFQAAFFGGYQITERYAHGYRVGYYERGTTVANGQTYRAGVGMDATVYSPIIDLRFVNDTPHHLLMEAYYNATEQSLTFKFYSTSVGRVVNVRGAVLTNPVPHGPPVYTESNTMRAGQQRQIDDPVDGVDARVYRTITQNGQVVVNEEEFYSHYLPWSAQILVAPGEAPRR